MRFTSTSLVILRPAFSVGRMRPHQRHWLGIYKLSPKRLDFVITRAPSLTLKNSVSKPIWTILPGFFPSWLILLSFRKSSISNTLYYLHSFITPVRFMMARAGTQWIFLVTD